MYGFQCLTGKSDNNNNTSLFPFDDRVDDSYRLIINAYLGRVSIWAIVFKS